MQAMPSTVTRTAVGTTDPADEHLPQQFLNRFVGMLAQDH